ncbi:MAG: hypothetical protein M3R58_04870 [Pseudomonadota bacterium]|nr:hypothetical protein [Pseudomonadota bacterium]
MTDSDDRIARRYRGLAREEPPPALDAAILAKARQATGDGPSSGSPEATRVRPRLQRWAGPMSIAAVLVLGIGVSLRMQLEQPGIETSVPAGEPTPAPASEYSLPPSAEPLPDPAPAAAAPNAKPAPAPKAARQNRQDPARAPKPFADEPVLERSRDERTTSQAVPAAPPAPAFVPAPAQAPALESLQGAPARPAAAASAQDAAAQGAPPLRAKREAVVPDSVGTRELRKSIAPQTDADPDRELERIARLREAGSHAQADGALAEFRRRRPDYRIPEGMWERVKPR